jgi:hypothetical protein
MLMYNDLLKMGFKRNDILENDSMWFNQHGYRCFWLEKEIFRNKKEVIHIEWEPTKGKLELIATHDEKDIVSRREITEGEMRTLIDVFERSGNIPEPVNYNMLA